MGVLETRRNTQSRVEVGGLHAFEEFDDGGRDPPRSLYRTFICVLPVAG